MKASCLFFFILLSSPIHCLAQDLRQEYESYALLKQQRHQYCTKLKQAFNYYGSATTMGSPGTKISNGMTSSTDLARIDQDQNISVYIESKGDPESANGWTPCKSIVIAKLGQVMLVNSDFLPDMQYKHQYQLEGNQLCRYSKRVDSAGWEVPSDSGLVSKTCSKQLTSYSEFSGNIALKGKIALKCLEKVAQQHALGGNIKFNSDGNYLIDYSKNEIFGYTLTTAWKFNDLRVAHGSITFIVHAYLGPKYYSIDTRNGDISAEMKTPHVIEKITGKCSQVPLPSLPNFGKIICLGKCSKAPLPNLSSFGK